MELRTIRYFCTAAELLHFSRAAQACNISQPALSHQIKALEEYVGCTLFIRSSKQVTLTAAGSALFEHCKNALDLIGQGLANARRAASRDNGLRIGVWTHFLLTQVLPSCLSQMRNDGFVEPILVQEMWGMDLFCALEEGRIDLAIASEVIPRRGYTMIPLFMEDLVLAVPRESTLAARETMPLKDIDGMQIAALNRSFSTRIVLDQALAVAEAKPLYVAEVNSPETLVEFSRQANVPFVGPSRSFDDINNVALVRLVDPTPLRPMMLITREKTEIDGEIIKLIEIIRGIWDGLI